MTSMSEFKQISVLLVEDNPGDARLILEMLAEVSEELFSLERFDRLEPALERLSRASVDVVLLDLGLPDSRGLETFWRTQREAPDHPIVVISGLDDEVVALEAVRAGAQDYLVKGRIEGHLLARVLRYAIQRKQGERRFRELADNINEVFFVMDAAFRDTLYINPAYEGVWGRSCQSLYDDPQSFLEAVMPEDRDHLLATIARNQRGEDAGDVEFRVIRPDGDVRWVLAHAAPVRDSQGQVYRITGVALDITSRKQAEDALVSSERRLRTLFDTVNLIVLGLDLQGRVDYVNPFLLHLMDYTEEEMIGSDWIERFAPQRDQETLRAAFLDLRDWELHPHHQNAIVTKAGKERMITWHNTVVRDAGGEPTGTLSVGEDVTEHAQLEMQFRQAQKMEAVGRLAGGVAHDFNNILTAIFGYTDLMMLELPPSSSVRGDLEEVRKAATRAAGLTRQLLAFSRQQVLQPTVLNLNDIITNLESMLARLIGEDVKVRGILAPDLGNVRTDAGQLEQVLMNLVVNARDAMPTGGELTIETANAELSSEYAEAHQPVEAGSYVMLAVTDTGIGMSRETKGRLFEPFYTTKEKGKGTGLGLSTVYGIVKQSRGYIWVYSEPGLGATFKIYLPRVDAPVQPVEPVSESTGARTATETILMAEDDELLRPLTHNILQRAGYRVIVAANADEALANAAAHEGPIHLLLADVVMPGESGRRLARRLGAIRPDMRVLYVSGYTDDAIVHHGMLEPGLNYLQKPFTPSGLVNKVREVLDSE